MKRLLLCLLLPGPLHADEAANHFESKVRPVLIANCYACHNQGAEGRLAIGFTRGDSQGRQIWSGDRGRQSEKIAC